MSFGVSPVNYSDSDSGGLRLTSGESSPSRGRSSKRSSALRYASRSKSPPERHSRRSVGKLGSRDSRFRLADDRSRGDNTGQLVKDPLAVDVLPASKVRFSTVP